jgi:Flp pilus assembly protein TadG
MVECGKRSCADQRDIFGAGPMRRLIQQFRASERGAAALEFAIGAPVLFTLVFGILQVGVLFYASAGLRQGVNEAARYATIYPAPTDAQIKAKVLEKAFGLQASGISGPTVTRGVSGGVTYVDISVTYTAPLSIPIVPLPPITMTNTRRAFQ